MPGFLVHSEASLHHCAIRTCGLQMGHCSGFLELLQGMELGAMPSGPAGAGTVSSE